MASAHATPRRGAHGVGFAAMLAGAASPAAVAMIGKLPAAPVPAAASIQVINVAPAPQPAPAPGALALVPPASPKTRAVSNMNLAQCLARYQAVAMPFERGDDADSRETIVCRRGYVLSYDAATHDPDWVMELLTPQELRGTAQRSDNFTQDPLLGKADAQESDYKGSHFDRGHQAPAGDSKFNQAVMDQSFFFSNMAPQVGIGFNRGAWKFLEENVRAWIACGGHDKLFVFTGPIYSTDARTPTLGPDKVSIPTAFFKIVYDPASDRAVGFVLPNAKIGSTIPDLQKFVKPIAEIETDTGLDFFRGFDARHQSLLETRAGLSWGHIGSCKMDDND